MAKKETLTVFVRVGKAGPEQFFRCGERFTADWRCLEVDQATADRLHAEQMLEVSQEQPADYVDESAPAADEATTAKKTSAKK